MESNPKTITADKAAIYKQLQAIDHINILKILTCEEANGSFVITEEEFVSQPMSQLLRDQAVTGEMFYDWLLQICDAITELSEAKPPIGGVSLRPDEILIGEDNLLKLTGFLHCSNAMTKEAVQAEGIAAIAALMKDTKGKFMKKYEPLLKELRNGLELADIAEFRKEIIAAFGAKLGLKWSVWVGGFGILFLLFRLLRKVL